MHSPSAHEAPEGAGAQGQVGRHGAVFEGAVVGIEEVELVVLSGRVHDLLPEDDHPESALPFLDGYGGFEGVRSFLDPSPSALPGDLSLEVKSLPEGHLDGIGRLVFVQHFERALVEEGAVHAESQPVGAHYSFRSRGIRGDDQGQRPFSRAAAGSVYGTGQGYFARLAPSGDGRAGCAPRPAGAGTRGGNQ